MIFLFDKDDNNIAAYSSLWILLGIARILDKIEFVYNL